MPPAGKYSDKTLKASFRAWSTSRSIGLTRGRKAERGATPCVDEGAGRILGGHRSAQFQPVLCQQGRPVVFSATLGCLESRSPRDCSEWRQALQPNSFDLVRPQKDPSPQASCLHRSLGNVLAQGPRTDCVPHPVPWTHICAMPPGVAHTPRAPRSAFDTQASRDARSGCTAPRSRPRRRGRPRGSERFGRGSLAP